jgi:hypothetical protein
MYTYKRVALIGVDGAGTFFRQADTPNIDRIFADGSVAYDVYTAIPSISAECWGSMLHGVTPDIHRLSNGLASTVPYDPASPFPSAFRIIRENDPDCELASFCNWNPINTGIIEEGLNVYKDSASDGPLCDKICAYLEEHDPKFLFVQFDEVDGAGHGNGYGTEKHLQQISIEDGYIGRIWDTYVKRGFAEDTLFIVTADHGGFGHDHGGKTEEEMRVMYALRGKTVVKGGAAVDMQIRDSASIVLYALGYAQSENWTSLVPSGVFEGVEAGERPEYTVQITCGHRGHQSEPHPGRNVIDVLGADSLKAYFPFEGNNEDATGKVTVEGSGKFYHIDGYFDRGVRMDDGYLTLSDCKPGADSFSIGFWFKNGLAAGDPAVVSNKNWSRGGSPGFVLGMTITTVFFNVAAPGVGRFDTGALLPLDYKEGWVYVICSVDRAANTIGMSLDFEPMVIRALPEGYKGVSFDTDLPVRIGQDGVGDYHCPLSLLIDELFIANRALTDEDVAALKTLYTKE